MSNFNYNSKEPVVGTTGPEIFRAWSAAASADELRELAEFLREHPEYAPEK